MDKVEIAEFMLNKTITGVNVLGVSGLYMIILFSDGTKMHINPMTELDHWGYDYSCLDFTLLEKNDG